MARKFQTSFAGGEIDPALRERVDLDKYNSGLATAKNVVVGKTGAIISAPGRRFIGRCNPARWNNDLNLLIKYNGDLTTVIELGSDEPTEVNDIFYDHSYSADHIFTADTNSKVTTWPPSAITYTYFSPMMWSLPVGNLLTSSVLLFSPDGNLLTLDANGVKRVRFVGIPDDDSGNLFGLDTASSNTISTGGYEVDYAMTLDVGYGEFVVFFYLNSSSSFKLPINVGHKTTITGKLQVGFSWNDVGSFSELPWDKAYTHIANPYTVRLYRRPSDGGAYGFIGENANSFTVSDQGQAADYSRSIPESVVEMFSVGTDGYFKGVSCCLYQGRLCIASTDALYLSQTGKPGNFLRNFPFTDDSAMRINFKYYIRHVVDKVGLLVFCDDGVYYSSGVLTPTNINFKKIGEWICDPDLPPLQLTKSVLFFDKKDNVVRELVWTNQSSDVSAEEISIFSDHLVSGRRITSWAFQDGKTPAVYVTLSDGTSIMLTYIPEHKMNAWTKGETMSGKILKFVAAPPRGRDLGNVVKTSSDVFALVQDEDDEDNIWIEHIVDRFIPSKESMANPESDKWFSSVNMTAFVSYKTLLQDKVPAWSPLDLSLTPVNPGEWDGDLTLQDANARSIFPDPGTGTIGTIFKWFHPETRVEIVLEITGRTDDDTVTVTPSNEFPSEYAQNPRLYECKTTFTGLDHLEGKSVSILADGNVVASPLNNIENYPAKIVAGGSITLDEPYAIVHIGLPVVNDVETLDITETGQGRGLEYTRLESITCNKVFIKTKDTRTLYVGNKFPKDNQLVGDDASGTNMVKMDGFDSYDVNYEDEDPIIGNRYNQPKSRRVEQVLPGDWKSRGRVCIRNVDPVHFEILSIVPDIDISEA